MADKDLPTHTISIVGVAGKVEKNGRIIVSCINCGNIVPPGDYTGVCGPAGSHTGVYATANGNLCSEDCLLEYLNYKLAEHFRAKGGTLSFTVTTPKDFDIADTYVFSYPPGCK